MTDNFLLTASVENLHGAIILHARETVKLRAAVHAGVTCITVREGCQRRG